MLINQVFLLGIRGLIWSNPEKWSLSANNCIKVVHEPYVDWKICEYLFDIWYQIDIVPVGISSI